MKSTTHCPNEPDKHRAEFILWCISNQLSFKEIFAIYHEKVTAARKEREALAGKYYVKTDAETLLRADRSMSRFVYRCVCDPAYAAKLLGKWGWPAPKPPAPKLKLVAKKLKPKIPAATPAVEAPDPNKSGSDFWF